MFHKSKIAELADHFPQDQLGYVPTHGDCWREMKFDHADQDPNEEGISAEERARRIEHLDQVWWPQVLAQVQQQRERLEKEHGPTFAERWKQIVETPPPEPHGFEVE